MGGNIMRDNAGRLTRRATGRAATPHRARATAVILATFACAAGSVTAATGAAAAPAASCRPAILHLHRLPSSGPGSDTVADIGAGTLSVGTSGGVPVYWTGTTVHKVPLPAGYTAGEATAVNKNNLLVGTVRNSSSTRAFRYTVGAASSQLLANGTYASGVNDNGRITGGNATTGAVYVWAGTHVERTLALPAHHTDGHASGIAGNGTVVGGSFTETDANGQDGIVALVWPAVPSGSSITVTAHDLPPVVINNDVETSAKAIDEHGRVVGNVVEDHQDLDSPVFWDKPYSAGYTGIAGLANHEGKDFVKAISPSTGLIAGTAQFPDGIPPITPVDQPEISDKGGPLRALPSLAVDAPAGADSAGDNGSVGGWAYDADPYDGNGVRQPVIWTCAVQQAFTPADVHNGVR
jgi:hypothetical protein